MHDVNKIQSRLHDLAIYVRANMADSVAIHLHFSKARILTKIGE